MNKNKNQGILIALFLLGIQLAVLSFAPVAAGAATAPTPPKAVWFDDVAGLPSRLIPYRFYQRVRQISAQSIKSQQSKDISDAIALSQNFVAAYPESDFAPMVLMNLSRLLKLQGAASANLQIQTYLGLVDRYPNSPLADDALWNLAELYRETSSTDNLVATLRALVNRYPMSPYVPKALNSLSKALAAANDEAGALEALSLLIKNYSYSDLSADALYEVAKRYQAMGNNQEAIDRFQMLLNRYPYHKQATAALMALGGCLQQWQPPSPKLRSQAIDTYQTLLRERQGSPLCRDAMREINTITPGSFDLDRRYPCDEADEMYGQAVQRYQAGDFENAIPAYLTYLRRFPGHDHFDEAALALGVCFRQLKLFEPNQTSTERAADVTVLLKDLRDALEARNSSRSRPPWSKASDAYSVYLQILRSMKGSSIRSDALIQMARCFEAVNHPVAATVVYEQLMLYFPENNEADSALQKVLLFCSELGNYPASGLIYQDLSGIYPDLFPSEITNDPQALVSVMSYYVDALSQGRESDRGDATTCRVSLKDLQDPALIARIALALRRGEYKKASSLLESGLQFCSSNTIAASLRYQSAFCLEKMGKIDGADKVYQEVTQNYKKTGLADDAEAALAERKQPVDPAWKEALIKTIKDQTGLDVLSMDSYYGENVAVFMPYLVSLKLREYNIPNLWDAIFKRLVMGTGIRPASCRERPFLVMILDDRILGDRENRLPARLENIIRLNPVGRKDPPSWEEGLDQIVDVFISSRDWTPLEKMGPVVVSGFRELTSIVLQYHLLEAYNRRWITVGTQQLLPPTISDKRQKAIDAFAAYMHAGADLRTLSPEAMTGMLFQLMDEYGDRSQGAMDWTPYQCFFSVWLKLPSNLKKSDRFSDHAKMLVYALSQSFNVNLTDLFKRWGFPVQQEQP